MNCFRLDFDYFRDTKFYESLFYFGKDDVDNENKDYL